MLLNIHACPHCGGTEFAVEVQSWVNIEAAEDNSAEYPHFDSDLAEFDQEDAAYAEPIKDGLIICRNCHESFRNAAPNEPATEVTP